MSKILVDNGRGDEVALDDQKVRVVSVFTEEDDAGFACGWLVRVHLIIDGVEIIKQLDFNDEAKAQKVYARLHQYV